MSKTWYVNGTVICNSINLTAHIDPFVTYLYSLRSSP